MGLWWLLLIVDGVGLYVVCMLCCVFDCQLRGFWLFGVRLLFMVCWVVVYVGCLVDWQLTLSNIGSLGCHLCELICWICVLRVWMVVCFNGLGCRVIWMLWLGLLCWTACVGVAC